MMTHITRFLAIVLFLASSFCLPAADAPSLDQILKNMIKAQGGEKAIRAVKARVMRGTVQMAGAAGAPSPMEAFAMAPNKSSTKTDIAGLGTVMEGFDGQVAWAKNPWEGLRLKTGDELAKTKRDSDLYRVLRMKELYPGLSVKGQEQVGTNSTYVLESKPTPTSVERFYINSKTWLPVRQESILQVNGGEVRSVANLLQYKPADGVQYPRRVDLAISTGGQDIALALTITDITHPATVETARFAKPAE